MRLGSGFALVTLALATITFLPLAAAQVPTSAPSTLELRIAAIEHALVPGEVAVTRAEVQYCYFALGATALTSTRVQVSVAAAPAWAVVTVSPATLLVPIQNPPSPSTTTCAPPQSVSVYVTSTDEAPPGAVGTLALEAFASANPPMGAASAEDQAMLLASREPCHHAEAGASSEPVALEEKAADDFSTQSAGLAPVRATAAPLALGLVGVGAIGAFAWRRRRA